MCGCLLEQEQETGQSQMCISIEMSFFGPLGKYLLSANCMLDTAGIGIPVSSKGLALRVHCVRGGRERTVTVIPRYTQGDVES